MTKEAFDAAFANEWTARLAEMAGATVEEMTANEEDAKAGAEAPARRGNGPA